jgi:hypothetical protein
MEQKMRDSLPLLHFSSCTGVPQDSELLERHGTAKSDVLSKPLRVMCSVNVYLLYLCIFKVLPYESESTLICYTAEKMLFRFFLLSPRRLWLDIP